MRDNPSNLPSFNGSRVDGARADETVRTAAARALDERGLKGIDQLLAANTPVAILGWCKWWDSQRDVGIELLASRIFSGKPAPRPSRVDADEQKAYGEGICRFLAEKMPDVCRRDRKVIEWHRRCFGDADALALEGCASPHPAAVAAVIRLHYRHGKGALTVREHGAEIREAVRRADEQAIADYERIAEKRDEAVRVEAAEGCGQDAAGEEQA